MNEKIELREPTAEEDRLARETIGAAIVVYRVLGPGLLESVYEEALCIELDERNIPFVRQPVVDMKYKGKDAGKGRLDLLIDNAVVVELKAVEALADVHQAQLISYLKMAEHYLGLLRNFNVSSLKNGIKRIIVS